MSKGKQRSRGTFKKGAVGRRISAEMRAQNDYKARRAAADAELAPVVMELVRGFEAEADAWWRGLTKQQQREECRE